MITVPEFKRRIAKKENDFLLHEVLLADGALHVSQDNIAHIQQSIARNYRVTPEEVTIIITGSAKIGFSLVEKKIKSGILPRYRTFSAHSDIDVAVVSQTVFELIWTDLSRWGHQTMRFPRDSGTLGDYLVCGWLRPDYFPKDARIRSCDDWWELFNRFSVDPRFNRRKVRGGLFYSRTQLELYARRAIRDCAKAEELD